MSPAPLLAFEAITKSFGAVRSLRGVSFTLHQGEVHALLGENGAGKSTLIKVATGAHVPDDGRIVVEGRPYAALNPAFARALAIACIYQQPALFPDLTVAENLALRLEPPGRWRTIAWADRTVRARALLERIGADIDPEAEARTLSMPEQQLVEIASAIGSGARILIMDEPTASLTRREQDLLFRVVRALRSDGVGIIYISHRLEEIFELADRVTVLRDGATVGTHTIGEIDEPGLIRLMVGRELAELYPARGGGASELAVELAGLGCQATGVHDVSFSVRAGGVFGLAGLVGAGRTELARVLFGLTPADTGTIRIGDRPVEIDSPRAAMNHRIAYVPEDRRHHGVTPELPIEQNITLAANRSIFPGGWLRPAAERRIAREFIERLSIRTSGPEAPVSTLSGGNQQKVAVARWLALRPRVLILDEPTQGVDIGAKAELHRQIRDFAKEGMAVILISSDLPEIIGMSDRIGVMRGGTLISILPGGAPASGIMAAALGAAGEKAE